MCGTDRSDFAAMVVQMPTSCVDLFAPALFIMMAAVLCQEPLLLV